MSENYFKVFQSVDDHYKWSKQKEYALLIVELDEIVRLDYYNAIVFLEKTLGKDFLKSSHRNNLFRQMIIEKTEFRIYEVIEFVDALKTLKKTDINFSELTKKLLPIDKSKKEGVPFVEIAQRFIQQKFKVSFPVENNIEKSPDIKIVNPYNNDVFYIEVSSLNDSKEKVIIRDNYHFLFDNFHHIYPQFAFIGKQKRLINEIEYDDISKIIALAKIKVKEQEQIVYYSDNRFYFLIVPEKYEKELNEIVKKENLRLNNIDGLTLNYNLTNQIINKIKKEADQIPIGFNGLIYFPVSPLYFITTDFKHIIARIEEYLSSYKNILGIVIQTKIIDNKNETVIKIDNHLYRRRKIKNLSYETLYINNKYAELKVLNDTFNKIYRTL